MGADTFVFLQQSGSDTIADFQKSEGDNIDLSAYGFSDISELTLSDVSGTDTLVELGAGEDSILLVGLDYTALQSSDFVF